MGSSMDFFGATTGSEKKANEFLTVCNRVMYDYYIDKDTTMDLASISSNGVVSLATECLFEESDNDGYSYENAIMEYIKEHPSEDFSGYCANVLISDGGINYHAYSYHDGKLKIEHRYPEEECNSDFISIDEIEHICCTNLEYELARECGVVCGYDIWELANGEWEHIESVDAFDDEEWDGEEYEEWDDEDGED